MIKRETIQELKDNLDAVFHAYGNTEENLRKDKGDIPWGEIPDSDALKTYNHLEYRLANITRQAFVTMTLSWLEMAMDVIGEVYIPDYMTKVEYKDSEKKRKGSWFKKRCAVFRKYCNAFKGKTENEHYQFIENVRIVRNCVVHAGGRVEKADSPNQVDKAVKWIWEKAQEGNFKYAEILSGLIYLREDLLPEVVIVSMKIVEHIWQHAENESR